MSRHDNSDELRRELRSLGATADHDTQAARTRLLAAVRLGNADIQWPRGVVRSPRHPAHRRLHRRNCRRHQRLRRARAWSNRPGRCRSNNRQTPRSDRHQRRPAAHRVVARTFGHQRVQPGDRQQRSARSQVRRNGQAVHGRPCRTCRIVRAVDHAGRRHAVDLRQPEDRRRHHESRPEPDHQGSRCHRRLESNRAER